MRLRLLTSRVFPLSRCALRLLISKGFPISMCAFAIFMATASASSSSSISLSSGKPNQLMSFNFPKQKFGQTKPVYCSVQPSRFTKWPWLHYDQAEGRMFCHTCVEACKKGMAMPGGRKKDTFITVGYTNWKHAAGGKSGG